LLGIAVGYTARVTDLSTHYLSQAAGRSEHWSGPPEIVERIAAYAATGPGCRVMDAGCGIGGPARRLANLTGCEVIAVDFLPRLLSIARDRAGVGCVRVVAADVAALPFADGTIDQVWCLGVVGHLPDLLGFGREAVRVLRPGGVILVTEALWDGIRPPRFARSAPSPWHALTQNVLLSFLEASGLIEARILPWPGAGIPGALDADDALLRRDLADRRLVPVLVAARRP
jgi:SAM-dependent methyltransferase